MINVAYMTSLRELALSESAGREVIDPISGKNHGYRRSMIEYLSGMDYVLGRDLNRPTTGQFPEPFHLNAIVVDDNEADYDSFMFETVFKSIF